MTVTQGVWPPEDAATKMMTAAREVAIAMKELVSLAKTACEEKLHVRDRVDCSTRKA